MIERGDILSLEFLKKSAFTGSHQGMRYRLEGVTGKEGKALKVTVWPEPFNYGKTPEEKKTAEVFSFDEEGVEAAVAWMNQRLELDRDQWEHSWEHWTDYHME